MYMTQQAQNPINPHDAPLSSPSYPNTMNRSFLLSLVTLLMVKAINPHVVTIVGLPDGQTQSLPTSYVQSFPRWVVGVDGELMRAEQRESFNLAARIPSVGLQLRPTLDVLLKNGVPTYVMVGIEIFQDLKNGDANNLILREYPLARQWTTFQFTVEPNFRVELLLNGKTDSKYVTAGSSVKQFQNALQRFGVVLSSSMNDDKVMDGIHIVSLPLMNKDSWTRIDDSSSMPTTVTCLATAEPDAETVATLDEGLLEMTASSILEFTIVRNEEGEQEL